MGHPCVEMLNTDIWTHDQLCYYLSIIHWFSYATKTLITNWISFLQIGQEAPAFFSLLAQWKQVTRWPVLLWIMFPFRGLFSHRLHGFRRFWQTSMFSVSFLCSKRLSDCSPMLDMVSWLSELWAKSQEFHQVARIKMFRAFFLYVCIFRSNNWSWYSSSAVRDINSFTFLLFRYGSDIRRGERMG